MGREVGVGDGACELCLCCMHRGSEIELRAARGRIRGIWLLRTFLESMERIWLAISHPGESRDGERGQEDGIFGRGE